MMDNWISLRNRLFGKKDRSKGQQEVIMTIIFQALKAGLEQIGKIALDRRVAPEQALIKVIKV
jgi:hypothetical protein